jgi:hypothetical protein
LTLFVERSLLGLDFGLEGFNFFSESIVELTSLVGQNVESLEPVVNVGRDVINLLDRLEIDFTFFGVFVEHLPEGELSSGGGFSGGGLFGGHGGGHFLVFFGHFE